MLENKYLENPKKFSLSLALPDIIIIYNENIHTSTKYKPNYLFSIKDDNINNIVKENIKKSQKKFKCNDVIKINSKCLLCENFELKGNRISMKKLGKKGKYTMPCIVVDNKDSNCYKINFQ